MVDQLSNHTLHIIVFHGDNLCTQTLPMRRLLLERLVGTVDIP